MADSIFKQLSSFFNGDDTPQVDVNNPKVIYTTDNKKEFEDKKSELKYSNYLKQLGHKILNYTNQQTKVYEGNKRLSYIDFEQMEYYPLIARALDIYSEESTTSNKDGFILNIHSENKKIKFILENLFYNVLDIHSNIFMWIRNLCKYGNNYLYIESKENEGIINVLQLPTNKITREEQYTSGKHNVIFKLENGQKYNEWQIAHFRLLFDDGMLPYGMSILEKVRRTWKNLLLAEDAMRVYRILRAPERRVFKINVGNIDPNDVEAFLNETANKFKRDPVFDPYSNTYNSNLNVMSIGEDYFIPVRGADDGSSIETLAGATNLDQIADLEYDIKQLMSGLGIPKSFLNYEEAVGDGQNLAIQDVRFARTINRIQQSFLQECNKIAQIHLFILGLKDELGNFTLSLNNPSTQSEKLRIEELQTKISVFRDATSLTDVGFPAYSITKAMKEILGFSDEEIKLNFEQQRLEKAASIELESTNLIIQKSGIFNRVDKLYGVSSNSINNDIQDSEKPNRGGGGGGGGFASNDFGGGSDILDTEETTFDEVESVDDNIDIQENNSFDLLIQSFNSNNIKNIIPDNKKTMQLISETIKTIDDISITDLDVLDIIEYEVNRKKNKFEELKREKTTDNKPKQNILDNIIKKSNEQQKNIIKNIEENNI